MGESVTEDQLGAWGTVPKDRKRVKMFSSKERTGIFRELKSISII